MSSSLLVSLIIAGQPAAVPIAVKGRVVDETNRPLAIAYAKCSSKRGGPVRRIYADVRGAFSFSMPATESHLSCLIGAKGYAPLRRTVAILAGQADIGVATLKKISTLEIGKPLILGTATGSTTNVDVVVRNPSARDFEVRGIVITGTARLVTECYDPRPAVSFKIGDKIAITGAKMPASAAVDVAVVNLESGWTDNANAVGGLQKLGCNQNRLSLTINYLLPIRKGDVMKLRFQLPNAFGIVSSRGKKAPALNLQTWKGISIDFLLADGTKVRNAD